MNEPKAKNNLRDFFIRFGLSAALLWWLFSKIDTEKTLSVIRSADLNYLIAAGAAFIILVTISFFRWLIFVRALKLSVKTATVLRYFFIGLFGNLFLPSAIGGDLIKVLGLCRESSEKPKVVASVLLDRLSGFAGIVVVCVCVFTFGYRMINDSSLLIPIVILAAGSLTMVGVLFNERIYSFGCAVFNKLPKVKDALMTMHYDIALLKDRKCEGLKAVAISCLSQIILSLCFFLIAKALHQQVDLIYFFIFVPLICVVSLIPSLGGLGVREAGTAFLFARVGMEPGVAVSLSLMIFLFMVIAGLFGGVVYLITPPTESRAYESVDQ